MTTLGLTPKFIMSGGKILCLKDEDYNLTFIDSLSFLTMKLSDMPEALGFENLCKGFFPHGFSSEERLTYVGAFPPASDYGFERMSDDQQREFQKWYAEASKSVFHFEKEARLYCENDVEILAEACVRFRSQYVKDCNVDPFSSVTIASACMKVFRTNFLKPKSLAIPPADHYRRQNKSFSQASIQWLEFEADVNGIFIQHALNKGEKQIGPYFVDGYHELDGKKIVFEFLGCFFHGCPTCFQPYDKCPLRGVRFERLHSEAMEKMEKLRSVYGVQTFVMWEHEWSDLTQKNTEVKRFLEKFQPPEPLLPRDSLYGGRTCPMKLRYTASENEAVHYVDVTSLYPYVNATSSYPLGHPTVFHNNFDDPRNYFGLIKAKVYPPRGLLHPILPFRTSRKKLIFTLCRSCAETNNQESACDHDDEARALTAVWVTVEFNKALEKGYVVCEIYEVWHFENKSDTVFTDYINTFLKGKQEASGYPPNVNDRESREKYIRDYKLHQGIELDPQKIRLNRARRQVSKLCLNSLWGKFGQRINLLQTILVKDPEEFLRLMFSGQRDVEYFHFLNDATALVQWKYNKRCLTPPGNSNNVFVASFTTAYARLKLYAYLERLQDRVLYMDTDSLIYSAKEGQPLLELGPYLGDLTDELNGDVIQEFAAAGPKSFR
ncbi:uncharacterized protein LOC112138787 [Oryzias melastigma]|uniref:uncharacterized protein LOC112138787 n=1 Tax=Oryzias melastigma TaxID=30732 RepID=UPI00168CF2C1|nr:uncharacterized protein LOC112138787 [Oryzias melastigma]